jgi:hypothetical protein
METPEYFINRLKKAIEAPGDKRVFVMKRNNKIRVEVTQGVKVIEDVEFPVESEEFDEYEIDPKQLRERFEGPVAQYRLNEIFRNSNPKIQ